MVSVSLQAQLMKYNSWVSWRGGRRDEVMVKHQCSGDTRTRSWIRSEEGLG